jgi:hypothetical protein
MLRSLCLASLVGALAVGCSANHLGPSNPDAAVDAAPPDLTPPPPDLTFPDRDPTNHPQLPQVDNLQGQIMTSPEMYTVVWPGDEALGQRVDQFMGWMLGSDYWINSLAEYGVGAGRSKGVLVMSTPAPATIDDSEFKTIVKALIAGGATADANTAFSFIIPVNTTSTMSRGGGTGCNDYGGYHSQTQTAPGSGVYVAYMVNLQCKDAVGGGLSLFDSLTDVISHEAAEASTDTFPFTAPAWTNQTVVVGGEIGDLCVGLDTKFTAQVGDADAGFTQATYLVQRLYSQKIAATGQADPCVPAPSTPYFNVALDPTDASLTISRAAGSGTTIVKLEPYAFGNVGNIKWSLQGSPGTGITVVPMSGTARPGETIMMTITAKLAAGAGSFPLLLDARSDSGGVNEWFGSITTTIK